MRRFVARFVISAVLVCAFLSAGFTCGPGYISPLFDTGNAPEAPYTDFAAGQLGIIKPEYPRVVLYAAYRWVAGRGMNPNEQKAAVEVWKAELDNRDFRDDDVDEAVKAWVAKRTEVVGKDSKVPPIYVERAYGGYDFFPNCTRNAFETAAATLADRASSHGPSDTNVKDWIEGQDDVFENCAYGKQAPPEPPVGAPMWLVKDREYQMGAAEFYSLDYEGAKKRFTAIAQDPENPWSETADYLVARTLIRQASLSQNKAKTAALYAEAEAVLERIISHGGRFAESAYRLMGLVKYRTKPQERIGELAKQLTLYTGGDGFRQDLIDYTWLLDKHEAEILSAEEKRKEALKPRDPNATPTPVPTPEPEKGPDDDLAIYFYTNDKTVKLNVPVNATDADVLAMAEKEAGRPLTKEQQEQLRAARQTAYSDRFNNRGSGYGGTYWGEEKLVPGLLPAYLREDDLTDWLFTYQMEGPEAYSHALQRFKAGDSELWLMTAIAKASKDSPDVTSVIEAARRAPSASAAYPTIAYHTARVLIEQNKQAEARKVVEEALDLGDRLPVSAKNSFIGLRLKFAQTLDDYLTDSLRKPYGFDFDGNVGTVDEFIAEQKTWFNPEYNKEGREAYEREIEDNFKREKLWQDRVMFDAGTVDIFNKMFPTPVLLEAAHSKALPDYLRSKFILPIWTRAYLTGDKATLLKVTPELARSEPAWAEELDKITAAKTPAAYERAVLYFILKNPVLSPYIEDGIGKADNEQGDFDSNDWWCGPYDTEYDSTSDTEVVRPLPPKPAFLTPVQVQTAQSDRKKLRDIGDAPKWLGNKVLEWAKAAPRDRRVPEALYIVIHANGWTKYGCGNDEGLKTALTAYLRKNYPRNEWTAKLAQEESENQ
jgi:hypothetical protein